MADALLEIRNLSCSIGGRAILRDIDLEVREGETVVLLGRSGSGKTTLLKTINGLVPLSGGVIRFAGRSTAEWDPISLRRSMGYVIQDGGLFPHWTVEANVGLVPRLALWPAERITQRVDELLTAVGLAPGEFRGRYPRQLSGGQKQRVGIARALAADPPLLLFDEPFAALDPITRLDLQRLFLELRRTRAQDGAVRHPRYPRGDDAGLADRAAEGWRARYRGRTARVSRGRDARKPAPSWPAWSRTERLAMNSDLASEILSLSLEHLAMVAITIAIAIAIALPAGVLLARRPGPRRWAVGFANIAQTIPSLALFGFLVPLPLIGGIGKRTAIVALCLYALLPILRNTLLGITGVDASVRESAVAMGMTARQILWQVELPLAAPSIVAGLRLATVATIGTATIAAAIGGGGLGVFIFRGISMVDTPTVLAGALPAAAMALAADGGLEWIERKISPA